MALIAHTAAASADGNSVTSSAIDTTGATFLFAAVARQISTAPTFSDSKGNTWTTLTLRQSAGNVELQGYYCAAPTVGSGHTVSVSGASTFPSVAFVAFSGTVASPLDQQNGAGSAGTSLSTGSVTPRQAGGLVLTALGVGANTSTYAVNAGFTVLDSALDGTGHSYGIALGYLVQGAASAVNPQWSWTPSADCAVGIAAFLGVPIEAALVFGRAT